MISINTLVGPQLVTILIIIIFLFRYTLTAGLERTPNYEATPEQAHQRALEILRDYHLDKYRSAILPKNKALHKKEAQFNQNKINKIDPNLLRHEHVITYKGEKVHSVEKRKGFIKKDDPSLLGISHQFNSIYTPTPLNRIKSEVKSPTKSLHGSPSNGSPIRSPRKGKVHISSSTNSSPDREIKQSSPSTIKSETLESRFKVIPLTQSYPDVSPERPKGKLGIAVTKDTQETLRVERPLYFKPLENTKNKLFSVNPSPKIVHIKANSMANTPESAKKALKIIIEKQKRKKQ